MPTRVRQSSPFLLVAVVLLVATGMGFVLYQSSAPFLAPLPLAVCLLILVSFRTLTVSLDERGIRWRFNPLVESGVNWSQVRSVEVGREPWYWGWGIRWTPRGWLWRIRGLGCVWIVLADGTRRGVGADDPEALATASRERIPA